MIRLALVGDPVEHSLSPTLHARALEISGLEGEYTTIRADEPLLDSVVAGLRAGEMGGLNVTMPLKLAALQLCDVATDEAGSAGSVNTMRVRRGLVEGHSTDVVAFVQVFEAFGGATPLLILGAGGAARAAIEAWPGKQVYVSARSETKAAELGSEVIPWGTPVAGSLLVNATPLGMNRESLPKEVLDAAMGLIDLAYGREETPAVRRARRSGIEARDGLEFLARQASASFQWWTGFHVDWEDLATAARKI